MNTLQGALRYGSLGSIPQKPAFFLFVPGKPAMRVVAQDRSPLPVEHLISFVNLRVEVRGRAAEDTFRLLGIERLESPPLPQKSNAWQRPTPTKTANPRSFDVAMPFEAF